MRIKLLFVAKTKDSWLQEGESEYLKRLQKYSQLETVIVNEVGKGDKMKILKEEGENILKNIKDDEFVCLLDVQGKQLSSEDFSGKIQEWRDFKGGKVCFIVGGSWGVNDEIKNRADFKLSFSKMTFTHQMMRVILLEQIFRAFKILEGGEYHK